MRLIYTLFITLLASLAYGAPSISTVPGAPTHGGQLSIVGTGFGTKSPAAPVLWAPFDSGLNPSGLGVATAWQMHSAGIYHSPGTGFSGGSARVYADAHSSEMLVLRVVGWHFNDPGQRSYIHRRAKRLYNSSMAPGGDVDGNGGLKSLLLDYNSTYADSIVLNRSSNQWITQNLGDSYYYFGAANDKRAWQVEEFELEANSTSMAACVLRTYIDHSLVKASPTDGLVSMWAAGDQLLNDLSFWRYMSAATLSAAQVDEYWDDLYVDSTWARVVIGDASTLSASTHREIQIPSAWSDSGITITINQGAFAPGDTAYLYVIDAAGVASEGRAITFGSAPVPGRHRFRSVTNE